MRPDASPEKHDNAIRAVARNLAVVDGFIVIPSAAERSRGISNLNYAIEWQRVLYSQSRIKDVSPALT